MKEPCASGFELGPEHGLAGRAAHWAGAISLHLLARFAGLSPDGLS